MKPCIIEVYTGLTLNYSLKNNDEYRTSLYSILRLFLGTEKKELSAKDVLEMTKQKMINNISDTTTITERFPIETIKEILNELHYYSILSKVWSPENDVKYMFM